MENTNLIQDQWTEICTQLAQSLSDRYVMRWLSKVVPDKIENNQVNLMVSSPCIHELIQQNYLDKIASLWKSKNTGIPRKYLRNINVRWFSFDLSDLLEMMQLMTSKLH